MLPFVKLLALSLLLVMAVPLSPAADSDNGKDPFKKIREQMEERERERQRSIHTVTVEWDFPDHIQDDNLTLDPYGALIYVRDEDGRFYSIHGGLTIAKDMEGVELEIHLAPERLAQANLLVGLIPRVHVGREEFTGTSLSGEIPLAVGDEHEQAQLHAQVPLQVRPMIPVALIMDQRFRTARGQPGMFAYRFPGANEHMLIWPHWDNSSGDYRAPMEDRVKTYPVWIPDSMPFMYYRDSIVVDNIYTWQGNPEPFVPGPEAQEFEIPWREPPTREVRLVMSNGEPLNTGEISHGIIMLKNAEQERDGEMRFSIGEESSVIRVTDQGFRLKYGGEVMARYPSKVSWLLVAGYKKNRGKQSWYNIVNEVTITGPEFFESDEPVILELTPR